MTTRVLVDSPNAIFYRAPQRIIEGLAGRRSSPILRIGPIVPGTGSQCRRPSTGSVLAESVGKPLLIGAYASVDPS